MNRCDIRSTLTEVLRGLVRFFGGLGRYAPWCRDAILGETRKLLGVGERDNAHKNTYRVEELYRLVLMDGQEAFLACREGLVRPRMLLPG